VKQYIDLMNQILEEGRRKDDRTGTGTTSMFGGQMRFNLKDGFPLVTTKKVYTRAIIHELLWFLAGDTNIKYLQDNNVHIWNEWAEADGSLGPVYGHQWRSWETRDGNEMDQIAQVQRQLRNSPDSRRIIVSAWNVAEIDEMALPPCHCLFQFYSVEKQKKELARSLRLLEERKGGALGADDRLAFARKTMAMSEVELQRICEYNGIPTRDLSCQLYIRSQDVFLGCPFNIAEYALLTHMLAQTTGHDVGEYVHTIGDAHLYSNHIEQAKLQLSREPRSLPQIVLNPEIKDIFDFRYEDVKIVGYDPHPTIKAKVAV